MDDEEIKSADTREFDDDVGSDSASQADAAADEVSWNQQLSSIIFGIVALLMFALIVFKGEHFWTVMHNFIFGILGNMSILWNALLVYSGYMFAKQKEPMRILEITRGAAGIILFIDVLTYILIQSNGYRNVDNELTYGFLELMGQIYNDGSHLGGTGLIGGMLGEALLQLLGKMGGAIVCGLALFGLAMLISHTTPVALIENIRRTIRHGWLVTTAMFREELPQRVRSLFTDDDEAVIHFDEEFTDEAEPEETPEASSAPEDIFVFTEEPQEALPDPVATTEDTSTADLLDRSIGDVINTIAAKREEKKKKKKKTRAEAIQEEQEAFSQEVSAAEQADAEGTQEEAYQYPGLRLLIAPKNTGEADSAEELRETADKLISTLAEYGVKASISNVSRGPTVTRYEINPAPGVKINKITNLSNDIALRLAAQSIRIEAPIPGKPAVGIEIPNKNKQMVRIREILGSREFAEAKGSLVVALGRDIEGNIVLCDLSKMPHLLIAGSTGSGKSVCVNSMLMSILYKYSPQEVRMVLIDPKSVEFDMYNGIPHLLVPVVCEPKKAAGALQWAVSEMLKRYGLLKEHGVRNIDNYNRLAEETGEFEKLCRIVIVIDEMADLMIASPKEVEDSIARLAAMARAAGMYMVLATQRPSVDVITGTIKNNIPSRIALAVSSQVDSRTILDEGGAENLIGYGDMLYHPMGASKHTRVQGCFVDDVEVERVIQFVKKNGSAEYDDSIADEIERNSLDGSPSDGGADFEGKDEFFDKAVEVVTEAGQASTSMLQRRLGVGYARAGRIIDQLEEQGIIGPFEGSKPRAVLITHTQWLEMTMGKLPTGKNDPIIRSHSEFAAQTLDNGHEEITARQSEFFNADESEDEYFEEETEAFEKEAFYEEEDPAEEDFPDDGETEQPEESAGEVPDEADETGGEDAPTVRDLTMFFSDSHVNQGPDEVPEQTEENPPVRDFTEFFTDNDEDAADKAVSDSDNPIDNASTARDFTSFFDNDDFTEPEDIDLPPWEDPVEPSETLAPEREMPHSSAKSRLFDDEEDDELYDDILSTPWVKRLNDDK